MIRFRTVLFEVVKIPLSKEPGTKAEETRYRLWAEATAKPLVKKRQVDKSSGEEKK